MLNKYYFNICIWSYRSI